MAKEKAETSVPDATQVVPSPLPHASTPPASMPIGLVHDPYRRATDLLQRLSPNKMRVGFFIGAGCSLAVQAPGGGPLIPEIAGLTTQVKNSLDADDKLKMVTQTAWNRVAARGIATPTVEDVLSHIRTLKSLCGKGEIDGFSAELLGELDDAICDERPCTS